MHRRLVLIAALTFLAALSLAGSASAQQVSSCSSGAYRIDAPEWAVPGSALQLAITQSDDGASYVSDLYLLLTDARTGAVLNRIDENENIQDIDFANDPDSSAHLAVAMPDIAENESVRIALGWTEPNLLYAGDSSCESVAVVVSRAGSASRFRIDGTSLVIVGSCEQTRATKTVVTFKGGPRRRTRRLTLSGPCLGWNNHFLELAGLDVNASNADGETGSNARLRFRATGNKRYRMEVRSNGKLVMRRTLTTHWDSPPDVRVYRGTDAFWNFCINESRDVYSSAGRLYCVRPGHTKRSIDIS